MRKRGLNTATTRESWTTLTILLPNAFGKICATPSKTGTSGRVDSAPRSGYECQVGHVKPISYVKSHAAEIVKTITESGEPMLIT